MLFACKKNLIIRISDNKEKFIVQARNIKT